MFDLNVYAAGQKTEQVSTNMSDSDLPKPTGLGFDVSQFVFYLVCFVIALVILQKSLFSKITLALTERENRIKNAELSVKALEEEINNAESTKQKIITAAQEEARKIKQDAVESVSDEKQKIIDAANYMGEQILSDSKVKSDQILKQAQQNAQSESVKVVEAIYKKSVSNLKIDQTTQDQVLSQILKSI